MAQSQSRLPRWVGLLALICVSANLSAQSSRAGAAELSDSALVTARLRLHVSEFQAEWQRYWRESEDQRRANADAKLQRRRRAFTQCPQGLWADRYHAREAWYEAYDIPDSQYQMITSAKTAYATCPSWMLSPTIRLADDEGVRRDGALLPEFRPVVARARARLIAQLDTAASAFPADGWISGVAARFRLDQGDTAGAARAARACHAVNWWCTALQGLVFARSGNVARADSAFRAMRAALAPSDRCSWTDLSALLPSTDRAKYSTTPCADREKLEERLWWLADPLYRNAGNERLVEQETRRVEIELRRLTGSDERYAYDALRGGDAIVATLVRYGWPTYTSWGGAYHDRGRDEYYVTQLRSTPAPPYTSFEYSTGRVHAIPDWTAVVSPFEAVESDWQIAVDNRDGTPSPAWWPQEHYKPARRIVQLPEGQTVFLRRQDHVDVLTANRLDHPAFSVAQHSFDVMLLATSGPSKIDSIDQQVVRNGATARLRGIVGPTPVLLAIEALGVGTVSLDARTRFGATPPPSIAAMERGQVALSEPVFLEVSSSEAQQAASLERPTESLLARMLGTTTLDRTSRRVGIYWESYGVADSDSAKVTVRISSADAQTMRRGGANAKPAPSETKDGVLITWSETDAKRATTTLMGPVPVQLRTMTLDLSRYEVGSYLVEVSLLLKNGVSVSSRRYFTIAS